MQVYVFVCVCASVLLSVIVISCVISALAYVFVFVRCELPHSFAAQHKAQSIAHTHTQCRVRMTSNKSHFMQRINFCFK